MAFLLFGIIATAQNPIESETNVFQGTRYLLKASPPSFGDTVIFHIYYQNLVVDQDGVGNQLKAYRIKRNTEDVWDTTIIFHPIKLDKNNNRYVGYHNYFWNATTRDTANKYVDRYIDDQLIYLEMK